MSVSLCNPYCCCWNFFIIVDQHKFNKHLLMPWLCFNQTTWVLKWVVFSGSSWRCIFCSWAHSGSGRVRCLYFSSIFNMFMFICIFISLFTLRIRNGVIPCEYEMYPKPTLCWCYWPNKLSPFQIYMLSRFKRKTGERIFAKFRRTYERREALAKSGSWSLGVATDSS